MAQQGGFGVWSLRRLWSRGCGISRPEWGGRSCFQDGSLWAVDRKSPFFSGCGGVFQILATWASPQGHLTYRHSMASGFPQSDLREKTRRESCPFHGPSFRITSLAGDWLRYRYTSYLPAIRLVTTTYFNSLWVS